MNKPLTKERLKYYVKRDCSESDQVEELLSAEAFWREIVKNLKHTGDRCPVCLLGHPVAHYADCPWLLAQESE